MGEISLLLFGLLRQNMTFVRMFPFDFSCSGKGEPLFGTGISLHFWHFAVFEFVNIIFYVSPRSGEKVCKSNDFIRTIKSLSDYFSRYAIKRPAKRFWSALFLVMQKKKHLYSSFNSFLGEGVPFLGVSMMDMRFPSMMGICSTLA